MTKCPTCFLTVPGGPDDAPTQCPNCGRDYPGGWVGVDTTCIVLAGARTTGKSIYIAVMIKQLEFYAEQAGIVMNPASGEVRERFQLHYVNPLYQQRGMLQYTPPVTTSNAHQREPLVWVLTLPDGRHHHLVIRDVAGEDLENTDLTSDELPFFAHADAVFFLYDPLKIEDIVLHLRGLVPRQRPGEDPRLVLDHVLRLVGAGRPRLAVIMSKFDAMQALAGVEGGEWSLIMQNAGAAFFRDPGLFDAGEDEGMRLHEEVRSLLLRLNAGALVGMAERAGYPSGYRFFAVSALGEPPNGQHLNPRGITPFRCLDPLRWAMAGKGVL